ncbi:MAG: AI-2E family transporter [Stellaceae bacterium]
MPEPLPRTPAAQIARALGYLALAGLVVLFVWLTLKVDLVIFAGVLLAVGLRRAAVCLGRLTRLPVGWALAVVVVLILIFFAAIGWFFSQGIASQINQLSQQLPAAFTKLAGIVGKSAVGKAITQHVSSANLQTSPTSMVSGFFGAAVNMVEVVGAVVVIIFLGLYFAAEAELYRHGLLRLVAPARRPRAGAILNETASALWWWILGRLLSMTVLGVLAALGLWIIGVPLPVALGLLVGLLAFIPYIGAIVSAVPSVLIAASVRLDLALYVIVLFVAIHTVEGYILVPLVQRRVVHLPPALTLSALIIFGVLAGFLGLLLATPLVAAIIVVVRMAYVEDLLGDRGAPSDPSE